MIANGDLISFKEIVGNVENKDEKRVSRSPGSGNWVASMSAMRLDNIERHEKS